MAYAAKNYESLTGMPGFSETLLRNHFQLYQGYVTNANALADRLAELAKAGATGAEYAELKRRFGFEFNGMRLHELYFENLGGDGSFDKAGPFCQALDAQYGGFEAWKKDFLATGAMRGIGWAVLYRDAAAGRLFNVWINEHEIGHLAGCAPLVVMDVFEHAFMIDYGLKRADYLAAFMKAVDWKAVSRRF